MNKLFTACERGPASKVPLLCPLSIKKLRFRAFLQGIVVAVLLMVLLNIGKGWRKYYIILMELSNENDISSFIVWPSHIFPFFSKLVTKIE